jgi:LysM repeat protein
MAGIIGLIYLLTACTPVAPTATPAETPTEIPDCGGYPLPDDVLVCLEFKTGVLMQTPPDAQSVLTLPDGTLTVHGTVFVQQNPQAQVLTIMTLEGTAVLGARQVTRILAAGSQVIVSLDENGRITNLSNQPLPIDTRLLDGISLAKLPRPISIPEPIAPPPGYTPPPARPGTDTPIDATQLASGTAIPRATVCSPRDDWRQTYTIRSGDTLSRIGATYGMSAADIQSGNCLVNPNRLRPGDEIRVPPLPTVTPFAAATFTPSAVAFRADRGTISPGDCTIIRWDVFNISAVFFEEEVTTGNNLRQVCPSATTIYALRVVYPDGTQTTHQVQVTVTAS